MKRLTFLALLVAAGPALGAGAQAPFKFKPDTTNMGSVQRGAKLYMNYCSSCHSLKYLRYNRLGKDLGIPDDLLKQHLMFTSDKPGDHILSAMPQASKDPTVASDSERWFGRSPPDLSLTARERGADWVYSYLMGFYLDPTRPTGVNNIVLPGASMPHVLGGLQGYQRLLPAEGDGHHKPKFELAHAGTLSPNDYRETSGDLTNFMVYAAEPGRNQRMALGAGVLAFTLLLGVLLYFLKIEYWKDVH